MTYDLYSTLSLAYLETWQVDQSQEEEWQRAKPVRNGVQQSFCGRIRPDRPFHHSLLWNQQMFFTSGCFKSVSTSKPEPPNRVQDWVTNPPDLPGDEGLPGGGPYNVKLVLGKLGPVAYCVKPKTDGLHLSHSFTVHRQSMIFLISDLHQNLIPLCPTFFFLLFNGIDHR